MDNKPPVARHKESAPPVNGGSADHTDIFDDMTPFPEPRDTRVIKDTNGEKLVIRMEPQHINYVHRGTELAEYSPLEYAVCVTIAEKGKSKSDEAKDNIRGRPPRLSFDFDKDHPLADNYTQHLRFDKFPIPIISEKPPPGGCRGLPGPQHDDTNTDSAKHQRFAEWYGSLLWPWSTEKGPNYGRAQVSTWDELVGAVNKWREDGAPQSDKSRYYYLNSLAFNMRINNLTRKMLNTRRTEFARPLDPDRRVPRKSDNRTSSGTKLDAEDDADQWLARQSARNATTNTSRIRKKKWCYEQLEKKLKILYRPRKRKLPRRKKQTNAASGKLWKTHDHFWAKSKIEERALKDRVTKKEPAMTKEERVRSIGEWTPTSATLLATVPRVAVEQLQTYRVLTRVTDFLSMPCRLVLCTLRRR